MAEEEEALPAFICSISQSIMRDPVSCVDGHSYERAEIEAWLRNNNTSPTTGKTLLNKNVFPNIALRQAIEEWEEKYGMYIKRGSIELDEPPIASGASKIVYKGWFKTRGGGGNKVKVAVSKLGRGPCATEARTFLKLGRHPRLVRFFGQCVEGDDGMQLLVTELAPHGSLKEAFQGILERKNTTKHSTVMLLQVCIRMCAFDRFCVCV
jgi:hypothetical protein